ncbi:RHS repeat-associated core domain-containing protein [Tenacibaculum maritimum]|uniref:RHS repeat-associated core domain-containing protein n=1 Tax=Tenacibaculum maritimum TaxID=107401 RepID=UPI00132FC19C
MGVALIHMNGRMYDAKLGRFLSPDNFIQEPFSTQSFNRFGYVWNNPLKFTDPSGEEFIIAVIIGAVIGGVTAAIKGGNFGEILLGALIGGVAAGVGVGIANLAAGGAFFGAKALTVVGFWSGAMVGAVSGFAPGFTNAALTTWTGGGSFIDGLANGFKAGVQGALIGAAVGGVTAGIRANRQGLDFWSGEGTIDMTESTLTSVGKEVKYSNESHKNFVNSNQELKKLSVNVDNTYADGSVPSKNYVSKGGNLYKGNGDSLFGITSVKKGGFLNIRQRIDVYLSKSAFKSSAQLYMTTHHEYMHAYFFRIGLDKSTHHLLIDQWHFDQSEAWSDLTNINFLDMKISYFDFSNAFSIPQLHYNQFGNFKIINYLP